MKKWTVATFQAAKGKQKLGCCTAYDACFARLADEAGVPCILVGDSMGMTTTASRPLRISAMGWYCPSLKASNPKCRLRAERMSCSVTISR